MIVPPTAVPDGNSLAASDALITATGSKPRDSAIDSGLPAIVRSLTASK